MDITKLVLEALSKKDKIPKFIVHEHHAVKAGLHYDLRLEYNGVLVSWATRKLPQLINDEVKRITIFQQPDHDLAWFDMEGNIDDGYGKGIVKIWDKGFYDIIKWDFNSHHIVTFHGIKLVGTYVILPYFTFHPKAWLMFKKK